MLEFLTSNQSGIEMLIKIATLLVSVFTILWTVRKGLREFANTRSDKKDAQISNWMKLFTETTDNDVRLSTVSGLSKNCGLIYDEMFLLCGSEKDPFIKRFFERSLLRHAAGHVADIAEFNAIYFLCYLEKMETRGDTEESAIPPEYIAAVRKKLQEYRLGSELKNKAAIKAICETDEAEDMLAYILLSSKIIAASADKIRGMRIENALLICYEFFEKKVKGLWFSYSTIPGSIMRHSDFTQVQFNRCALLGTDMVDCRFRRVKFTKPLWDKVKLIGSKLTQTPVYGGQLKTCQLDRVYILRGGFAETELLDCKLNGAIMKRVVCRDGKWERCEHQGARYLRARFTGIRMFENKCAGASFTQCRFTEVRFCGSDMNGVKFVGCDLKNVDFAGADMINAQFIGCRFNGEALFDKAHNLSDKAFVRCRGIGKFEDGTVYAPGNDAGVPR